MRRSVRGVSCLVTSMLLAGSAAAVAQEPKSAMLTAELVGLLDARKLDSIAAKVAVDEYVGALYFAGTQLLVVKARYAAPERMDAQLAKKGYREIYIDLNSASVPGSKLLVADLGANGLYPRRRDSQFDTADIGVQSYAFDGEWGRAMLSEDDYNKAFQTAEVEYVRMLEALIAEVKKPS